MKKTFLFCFLLGFFYPLAAQSRTETVALAWPEQTKTPALVPSFQRGLDFYFNGAYAEALHTFQALLQQNPHQSQVWHMCGAMNMHLQKWEEAITHFSTAISYGYDPSESYYGRGLARMALGDLSGAVLDLNRALDFKPKYPEVLHDRAQAKFAQGYVEKGCADLKEAHQQGFRDQALWQQHCAK